MRKGITDGAQKARCCAEPHANAVQHGEDIYSDNSGFVEVAAVVHQHDTRCISHHGLYLPNQLSYSRDFYEAALFESHPPPTLRYACEGFRTATCLRHFPKVPEVLDLQCCAARALDFSAGTSIKKATHCRVAFFTLLLYFIRKFLHASRLGLLPRFRGWCSLRMLPGRCR